jgi:hypothetical protein
VILNRWAAILTFSFLMSFSRIIKDPLIHFVIIGVALFAVYALVNPSSRMAPENTILVSTGRIGQLVAIFSKTWQRPPTAEELKGLIDDAILEEAYYRKAVEMGIDRDDTMIRRRLRQKLEFLTDDTAAMVTPSEEDLEAYLSEHADEFRTEPTYTFRQLYFKPEKYGDDPLPAIRKLADELRGGGDITGDATLLPDSLENGSSRIIDGTFGTGFAENLANLAPGVWSDPIPSGYGLHLVRINGATPGELPSLEKVRPAVEREWANQRRIEARAAFNAELLKDYKIEVEWPADETEPETKK